MLLAENVELFSIPIPPSSAGRQLRDSGIGSRTGMSVVALQDGGALTSQMTAETVLPAGGHLLMLGSRVRLRVFGEAFEERHNGR